MTPKRPEMQWTMTPIKLWILSGLMLGVVMALSVFLLTRKPEQKPAPTVPTTTAAPTANPDLIEPETTGYNVGLCLPDGSEAWTAIGTQLKDLLLQRGHQVSLVQGDGTSFTQNKLLLTLMEQAVDCIVIAPVDSAGLQEASQKAEEMKIPIISYGSLWMDSPVVKGFVC